MTKSAKAVSLLLLTLLCLVSCQRGSATTEGASVHQSAGGSGRVDFALDLPDGSHLSTVDLHLVCGGVDQHHNLDITAGQVRASFGGLPAGSCHAEVTSTTDDGKSCIGDQDFVVVSDQTTTVTVTVMCGGVNEDHGGSVVIDTQFATYDCSNDRIASVSAIPPIIFLGETRTIQVDSFPANVIGTPTWTFSLENDATHTGQALLSASSGCITDACIDVTCTGLGSTPVLDPMLGYPSADVQVAVEFEDTECFDTDKLWVTCVKASVCGNGVATELEQCDDGNTVNGDGCNSQCTLEVCGDGILNQAPGTEECDDNDGLTNPATQLCSLTCEIIPLCGNEILEGDEECEDLNSSNTDGCTNDCMFAVCGDGFTQAGVEQCDDANALNTDACTNACNTAFCGDSFTQAGVEQCDDANALNTDACTNACHNAACGDGFTRAGVEQCDDANAVNTDACTSACHNAVCGDGFTRAGVEQCDDANALNTDACTNACNTATCGDGFTRVGVEQCDDANALNTDACTNACTNAFCGDNFLRTGVEDCDDGNASSQDNCTNLCHVAACGDGFTHTGFEECDDANAANTDDCTNVCHTPVCGDGFVQFGTEQCDDTNASNTDGCTTLCESALISDNFNRADNTVIGGVWTEATAGTANAEINGSKLRLNSDNGTNRPMVKTSYTTQTSGVLSWSFDMDFTRTSELNPYFQFMQLGDVMADNNQSAGVAVDLTWGSYGGNHNQFGFKASGGGFTNAMGGTTQLTGPHHINVLVDVVAKTYDILVDSVLRATAQAIPFRDPTVTQVSAMRFFQDQMTNSANGRTIDNVKLTKAVVGDSFARANNTIIGGVWTEFLAAVNPGDAAITSQRLMFSGANGTPASPLVSTTFPAQHAGTLMWGYTMSFSRNTEVTYFQFMQLGDAMSVTDQSAAVAIDLTWGSYGGFHNQFGYKNSAGTFVNVMGGSNPLAAGMHYIVAVIDLGNGTYDVLVDGVVKATAVAFRDPAVMQITGMRFFEDQMDSTATGRFIDNVALTLP